MFWSCNSFITWKPVAEKPTIVTKDLSYIIKQNYFDSANKCRVTQLVLIYKGKTKTYKVKFPRPEQNSIQWQFGLEFKQFSDDKLTFFVDFSNVSAMGYSVIFPIENDFLGNPIIRYEAHGMSDMICYATISNNRIDFCKNDYADSCFQIQRLEPPLNDSFVVEYSHQKNKANKLAIKKANAIFENGIDVQFPNSILRYIPEQDFGIVYLSKQSVDTLIAYFSLHDKGLWYIDSISDIRFKKTRNLNQRLKPGFSNFCLE